MTRRRETVDPVFSFENPLVPSHSVAPWIEALHQPVAITGGTGFVGSHVVDTLCSAGIRPRVLVRQPTSPRWISGCPVDWVEGSLDDTEALDRLVKEAGTVLHLAGVLRGATESDFLAGNLGGTERVIAAVMRHSPEARFVHVSSQAAIGTADAERGAPIDTEPRPISAYGRSKAAAEQAVRAFDGRWAILRPPAIYGPRDSDVFEFFRMASRGLSAAPSGDRSLTIAHVADVVMAVFAVAAEDQGGGIYHVGAANGMPMDAMLRTIAAAGGVPPRLVHFPPWVLKAAGAGGSALRAMGMKQLPLSRDKAGEILAKHWVLETQPSIERLGLPVPTAFDEGAGMTWEWYRKAGWLPRKSPERFDT